MYHDTRSVYSDIHLSEKNNITTPRPITDLGIRRALRKDDDLRSLKIQPQDEKIIGLMVKKGEWEKNYWKERLTNATAWDDAKSERDSIKLQKEINHRARVEIIREEDRHMIYMKKLERQKKRLKKKAKLMKELEKANKATEKALETQHKLKEEEMKQRIQKENENKDRQEKNWWDVTSNEYERKLNEKIEHDKKRLLAEEKREDIISDEIQRVVKENEKERMYFTERYIVYEKKQKANEKKITAYIERKQTTAQTNYQHVMKEKIGEIKKDVENEDKKLEHAIKTKSKLEKQTRKRMKKMLKKTQANIDQARETAAKALEDTSNQIHSELESKEKEQRKNIKKIGKEVKKWTKTIAKELKHKEEIMQAKQEERSRIMEQTRHVAMGSRIIRNKVLDRYGSENMDRKVFRVERFHSLGHHRPPTQDWNTSSISLL